MITLPERQWVALELPQPFVGGAKHCTAALHPPSGKIYFHGGDYSNPFGGSYSQAVWSLHLPTRLASPSNVNAGWIEEFPQCAGTLQPKRPDYTGWQWDAKRGFFWMVPGTLVAGSTNCANETANSVDDPNYLFTHTMSFDPASRTWTDQGAAGVGWNKTWWCILDAAKDRILQTWYNGGNGSNCAVFDLATKTWTTKQLGPYNSLGQEVHLEHCYLAADFTGRWVYGIANDRRRLHRFSMDLPTHIGSGGVVMYNLEDLGLAPVGDTENKIWWDSINSVLLYASNDGQKFFAYHPTTQQWEDLGVVADNGKLAAGKIFCWSEADNCAVWFGQSDPSPNLASTPYMFLYRYKEGPNPIPPGGVVKNVTLNVSIQDQASSATPVNWRFSIAGPDARGPTLVPYVYQQAPTTTYQNVAQGNYTALVELLDGAGAVLGSQSAAFQIPATQAFISAPGGLTVTLS